MTDEATRPAQEISTAEERRRPEYREVGSDNAVMSTAGFEHISRVAMVMAESGMMPESLTHEGAKGSRKKLPDKVVLARAFLVAEQAWRWKRSPLAIMQCASLVHNKLMWEGKLINAILIEDYDIRCKFQFGTWDPATESCDLTKGEGQGDMLAVRVSAMIDGELEYIDGSVGLWKTKGEGTPWQPGFMKRQCRFRGTRDWARAYEPGAMLGISTDDEPDEMIDVTPRPERSLSGAFGEKPEPKADPKPPAAKDEPKKAEPKPGETKAATTAASTGTTSTAKPSATGSTAAPATETGGATATGEVVDLAERRGAAADSADSRQNPSKSAVEHDAETGEIIDKGPVEEEVVFDVEAFDKYCAQVKTCKTWEELIGTYRTYEGGPAWVGNDADVRRKARMEAYMQVADLTSAPDHTADPDMFWLWMAGTEKHRVAPAFSKLIRTDKYLALKEAQQDRLAEAVEELGA